jgi:hypothetical protein
MEIEMDRMNDAAEQAMQTPARKSSFPLPSADDMKKWNDELHKLQETINGIDCLCHTQLGQIEALTTTMLRAMETPKFWTHPMTLKETLCLIQYLATDLKNYVNCAAEDVGYNYRDEADDERDRRIWDAFRAASADEASRAALQETRVQEEASHV